MKRKYNRSSYFTLTILLFMACFIVNSQISEGVYADTVENNGSKKIHQVKINSDYFIYNVYENEPSNFIKTLGGFAQVEKADHSTLLIVQLEFILITNKTLLDCLEYLLK